MAFTSIVIVIVVIYVFGYSGMIVYDLFLKKEPVEFMPKPKDVEIDISDEAGQFKPIAVGKDEPKHQPATAQRPAGQKPDEGIAAAQSNTDGQVEESSEKQKSATTSAESYSPSAIPFQSDNDNTEGKASDDIEPLPTDAETKKRINELVKLKRREILAEEMTALTEVCDDNEPNEEGAEIKKSTQNAETDEPTEDKTAEEKKDPSDAVESYDLEVRYISPEPTVSPEVSNAAGEGPTKGKTSSEPNPPERTPAKPAPAKRSRPPKPPKQPEFHSDAYFDILKVQIDDSKQYTKLQGGQTAEQVSNEAKCASVDEAFKATKEINFLWEEVENKRNPDESELQAIKKSEESSREAPPQFNI
ncbi:MAG: hypothetical protein ACOCOW_05375 [Prevotella sp.]